MIGGVAFGPLWGPLAVSFMTDVPAFAVTSLATLLAVIAFRREQPAPGVLVASVAVGFFAFTIRQYAIVTVVAILAIAIVDAASHDDRERLRRALLLAAAVLVSAVVFMVWWHTIPDGRQLSPGAPDLHTVRSTLIKGAGFVRLAGLMTLPLLLWRGPARLLRTSWAVSRTLTTIASVGTTVWLATTALHVPGDAFVGNYLMRDGVLSDIVVIGPRPEVLPRSVWALLVALASAAGVVLLAAAVPWCCALARRVRYRDVALTDPARAFLALAILGYSAAYGLAIVTGLQVYDRYALPLVALVALQIGTIGLPAATVPATPPRPAATVWALAALAALAGLGVAYTADSASFDGARWRAAEAAVRAGWPARSVNGGFEWSNYHRGDKLAPRGTAHGHPRELICVTVHVEPHPHGRHVIAVVDSSAPTRPTTHLVALRTAATCPAPRPRPSP